MIGAALRVAGVTLRGAGLGGASVGLSPTEHTCFSGSRFRTAGFPRYDFKAGISDAAFPEHWFAIALRARCVRRVSLH